MCITINHLFLSYRYKDLFFDVTTGPSPSFVFTLSLSFDYNVTVHNALPCKRRWQMNPMEHATFYNFNKGDDTGKSFYFCKKLMTKYD